MKISLLQMTSVDDVEQNLNQIINLIEQQLIRQGLDKAKLFVLPENSLYLRVTDADPVQMQTLNSAPIKKLQEFAQKHQIHIHLTAGITHHQKNWNASVLIHPEGSPEVVYKKIHLFDIQLQGQKPMKESDVYAHGDQVGQFNLGPLKFGSSICYDLRFSELYHQHAKNSVDVILVPAAFLVKTGQAHWETLLRARAIESQAYVLAPAQVGTHQSVKTEYQKRNLTRQTYGHTLAIDPWGQVINCLASGIGCLDINIDTDLIQSVRKQIPMQSHRRL